MRRRNTLAPTADMSSRPELKLDWCDAKAARYAVEKWHYSGSLPPGTHNRVGVWEDERFIGVVLFSRGANKHIGKQFGVSQFECCELTRIALANHVTPVSRIVRVAILFLRQQSAGIRLVVSFADPNHGHHGGIYQAGNWVYAGESPRVKQYVDKRGKTWHNRMVTKKGFTICFGKKVKTVDQKECDIVHCVGKHRYLMPLDDAMRKQIEPLRKPYPKRVRSVASDTSAIHAEEGGATPTRTL